MSAATADTGSLAQGAHSSGTSDQGGTLVDSYVRDALAEYLIDGEELLWAQPSLKEPIQSKLFKSLPSLFWRLADGFAHRCFRLADVDRFWRLCADPDCGRDHVLMLERADRPRRRCRQDLRGYQSPHYRFQRAFKKPHRDHWHQHNPRLRSRQNANRHYRHPIAHARPPSRRGVLAHHAPRSRRRRC